MRVFYLTMALFLMTIMGAYSQSRGKIEGQVASSDGNPVEFVSILLKGTTKGSITDSTGHFVITGVNAGEYLLLASFVGLESQEKRISLTAGQTLMVNFVLTQSSGQLEEILVSENRERYTEDNISSSLRLNSPLLEIPQNIQIVNRDMLNDQQVISMSDGLIRNVSGAVRLEHWGDLKFRH